MFEESAVWDWSTTLRETAQFSLLLREKLCQATMLVEAMMMCRDGRICQLVVAQKLWQTVQSMCPICYSC